MARHYVIQYKRLPWRNEWTTLGESFQTLEDARKAFAALGPIGRIDNRIAEAYTITRYKAVGP